MNRLGPIRVMLSLLLVLLAAAPTLCVAETTVQADLIVSRDRHPAGETLPVLIQVRIPDGWYLHGPADASHEASLIATAVSFPPLSGMELRDIRFPEPRPVTLPLDPNPLPLYSGTVFIRADLRVDPAVLPGRHILKGVVSYQACTASTCLPPEEAPVEAAIEVVRAGTAVSARNADVFARALAPEVPAVSSTEVERSGGLLLTLLGLFLGGLALNLTPCIYPLIPITVSYFGGRSHEGRGRILVHGGCYVGGLALTNSALGVAAALSGGMLGAALQSPWVSGFVAVVLVLLALSFFGVWELRLPAGLNRLASRQYGGYAGSLFMGLTLGVVAAPCIGPFILGLLVTVGQQGDPILGFVYFFVLSLGMGLPLAILGAFSGALDRLPGSGDWMIWVRKLLGWILLGMAAYMLSPVITQPIMRAVLYGAVAVAAGVHLGWIERTGMSSRGFRRVRLAIGVLLVAGGILWVQMQVTAPREGVVWRSYTPEALASARGTPVILDFSADWCLPCREMEEGVFTDPRVVALAQGVVPLKVDLTHRDPALEEVRQRFDVRGVPTVVFLDRSGREVTGLRVNSYVDASDFLDRMERLVRDEREERPGDSQAIVLDPP